MKSTLEHPLAFFDWYLENEISNDLKEFYSHITEELYFNSIEAIDKVNHTIKALNIHHQDKVKSEHIILTFEGHIKLKLKPEIKLTKEFIELGFQNRFSDKKEVKAYADFLRIKLSSIYNKKVCRDFPFLPLCFEQLDSLVNQYSNPSTNNTSNPLSFYFDMLFDNSIQSVKGGFIGNATLQENGYSYLQDHNYYIKEEMVEGNGSMPVFVTDIVKREDFLDRLLKFENTSIYNSIENEVSSKENIDDKVSCIQKVYGDIQVLLKRVLKLEDEEVWTTY